MFKAPLPIETTCAYDWPFVPVDSTLLLDNIRKLTPYVPEKQRAHMVSSWAAFASGEDSAAASMCNECTSLRAASKAADSAAYQLEKAIKKAHTSLSGADVPDLQKTQLAALRIQKRSARDACDSHISGCHGDENNDFAWLKRFAQTPIGLRRPRAEATDAPVPDPAPSTGANVTTDERLLNLKEKYEVVSSDDDDCSMFGHKSNKRARPPSTTNTPHSLGTCDIKPNQHLAILLECVPGDRTTAEWGVVKVVSRPVVPADSQTFTALVLDCILKGNVVVSGGNAGSKDKKWVPRRDTEDFDVANALCNVVVSRAGALALAPHTSPPLQGAQPQAIAALDAVVEGYKVSGNIPDANIPDAQTRHDVSQILGHRRPVGANLVEYSVRWGSGEETWEPAHLLGGAQTHVQAFLRNALPLPYNGVFVGDWVSFKFGAQKPVGFLQFKQFSGKGNAMMELGDKQVEQFHTQRHSWLDSGSLCFALRHSLAQAGAIANNFAVFDPNAWSNFQPCVPSAKHHMLSNCPGFLQREWWVLPICWAGGCALTNGSNLGFNAGGTHWTVAIVHKPPNAPTIIAHYDPAGQNEHTNGALQDNLSALRAFMRACCGIEQSTQIKLQAPVQAGGWECGHYVALMVQQLLQAASHDMPLRMMAFSFGLEQLDCLKRSLLHAVLLESHTALKAMCTAGCCVGTPCAFLVAELKEVAGGGWCRVVAGPRSFWFNLQRASGDFEQLPAPSAL